MMTRVFASLQLDSEGYGVIKSINDARETFAIVHGGNPFNTQWQLPALVPGLQRIMTWSGTLADDLFEGHPGNWMMAGAAALQQRTQQNLAELPDRNCRWCIRPHCRHVLSDVPSCRQFALDHAGQPIDLVLDPVSMLEPTMLSGLDEHLLRMFETLGPSAAAVFIGDAALDESGTALQSVYPGSGAVSPALVRDLLSQYVPNSTPIVIVEGQLDAVRSWLRI